MLHGQYEEGRFQDGYLIAKYLELLHHGREVFSWYTKVGEIHEKKNYRYHVDLPWKAEESKFLNDNRKEALKRL